MKMYSLCSLRGCALLRFRIFSSTNLNCTQDVGKTLIKERIYLEMWDLVKLLYTYGANALGKKKKTDR